MQRTIAPSNQVSMLADQQVDPKGYLFIKQSVKFNQSYLLNGYCGQ